MVRLQAGTWRSMPTGWTSTCHTLMRPMPTQRRWIGTKYLAKVDAAQKEWDLRAERIKEGQEKNLWDIFQERGFIKDVAGDPETVRELMRTRRIGAYVGVDPTADSLHIGHLLPMMPLFWMYMHGYVAVSLVGGSTAKVGDPTGRLKSRDAISRADMTMNMTKMTYQLKQLWQNVSEQADRHGYKSEWAWRRAIVNNGTWWQKMPFLEIIRRVGAHMRMGAMLSRDTVKTKMQQGDGMSFAEFSYPLMQGWDWFRLMSSLKVQMQIGGSDQFGNIVSGIEVVKAARASEPDPAAKLPTQSVLDDPVGFTVPLLTDSNGTKFGKSAGNAIWLDSFKTSPFDFYGYFVRRPDDDVEQLLKLFTFLPLDVIQKTMEEHRADPAKRVAQHLLAFEVVSLVKGQREAKEVQESHRQMYSKGGLRAATSNSDEYEAVQGHPTTLNNAPRVDMQLPQSLVLGEHPRSIARILFASRLASSVAEGQRLANGGGAYVAGAPGQPAHTNKGMSEEQLQFTPLKTWFPKDTKNFLIDGKLLILRKGKHNVRVIEMVSDEEYKASGAVYPGMPNIGQIRMLKENIAYLRKELAEDDGSEWSSETPQLSNSASSAQNEGRVQKEAARTMVRELSYKLEQKEKKQERAVGSHEEDNKTQDTK